MNDTICPELSHESQKATFKQHTFLEGKMWKYSPEAFGMPQEQCEEMMQIGPAVYAFMKAVNNLYNKSIEGKSILRNDKQYAPWVSELLHRGKPARLKEHAKNRYLKSASPLIFRPDLMLTEDGFALTEIECNPGGIGLTHYLYKLYEACEDKLWGSSKNTEEHYYKTIASIAPHGVENPNLAVIISDESYEYRPELEYMAEVYRKRFDNFYCLHPRDLSLSEDNELMAQGVVIHAMFRQYELFDLDNIPNAELIFQAETAGKLRVITPMKPVFEEKMNLAFFHHPLLERYWKEQLKRDQYALLKRTIPQTWIIDPTAIPEQGRVWGPELKENPLWNSWEPLKHASKKERDLIIKVSGFHEKAWGARSVTLGSDVSQEVWEHAVDRALVSFEKNPYVIQPFMKTKTVDHPIYNEEGGVTVSPQRLRICPYYMHHGGQTHYLNTLATLCPADKKLIHGMRDASLLPVKVL